MTSRVLSQALTEPLIGEVKLWPNTRAPANYLRCNGASVSRTTYAPLFAALVFSGTVTFTSGSGQISWPNHGLSAGDKVKFFTTGTMPANFTAGTHGYAVGTEYVVIANGLSAGSFQVSTSMGGTSITAGSAGSGALTAVNAPWGDGDGSATFNLPQYMGDFLRMWDGGAGIDANRAFGSEQLDALQGHYHQLSDTTNSYLYQRGSNGIWTTPVGGQAGEIDRGPLAVLGVTSDGVHGAPRVDTETRPRNQTLLPIIRYQ